MYLIIIGGGKVGYYLAKDLIEKGHEVTVIEKDQDKEGRFREAFGGIVVIGDGCDPGILEEAGICRADIVIAVTGNDEDNLVACEMAKRHFKVPKVIARVVNPRNRKIYEKLGIGAIVSSTEIISSLIEQEAITREIVPLLALKRGELELVEIHLAQDSSAIGSPLREISLPKDCIIAAIIRGDNVIIPRGDTVFSANDTVLVLASTHLATELPHLFYK